MNQQELAAAYAAPGRHYHNLRHIEDCLDKLAAVTGIDAHERRILEQAIWWHDVVYDATRSDNEERSAQLAEQHVPADIRDEVGRLIRLTADHAVAPGDKLGAILISIDLSTLGGTSGDYDAYAQAIRREYAHVPEAAYRVGRAAVLERFLTRAIIYPDPRFAERYEARARENIAREIAALRA